MNVLVLGATGFTGVRLVGALLERGHSVRGLARDMGKAASLEKRGMELRIGDIRRLEDIRTVAKDSEIIFNLTAYCRSETNDMRGVVSDGLRNLINIIDRAALKKYIWVSNVAVYGHPKFEARLTEGSPSSPDYALGLETVVAEAIARKELSSVTVRVPAIYGPGHDFIDSLKGGRLRLINGGENWQSRIHVEDLIQVLIAAMDQAPLGETYLAADDLPISSREFFGELAEALHVTPPLNLEVTAAKAFGTATRALNWLAGRTQYQLNENVIGLLTGNYYCLNAKMKSDLGISLKYPTFRDGYEEMLTAK